MLFGKFVYNEKFKSYITMKREIKFRGLRIDGKGWVYGYYAEFSERHIIYVGWKSFQVIQESIGQYTELKDKNGVDIYEGDWLHQPGYVCRVEFLEGGFHTIFAHPEDYETLPILDVSPSKYMTVIGNIHYKEVSNG